MSIPNFKMTRRACYTAYFTMSSIFCVPPILFVTFREMYGISYTLLGTLVLVNFFTQLGVDLLFTMFSKHFNAKILVRVMPIITAIGLLTYALIPSFFPNIAYIGLLVGTVIFSVAAGLSEVLLSPVIAAIPSDNPQRDMSLLHSLYAFGTFTMIILSTVFLKIFGADRWAYLIVFLAILPLIAAIMFMLSPMPNLNNEGSTSQAFGDTKRRAIGLALFVACIFFGSCSECAMGNWISTYIENALGISKVIGDVLGAAMFAILLGIARILYAKFGKSITKTLLISMIGAATCYLVAGFSPSSVAFVACILTGFCTSMLWPGTLIMLEEKFPSAGVAAFALMAAGGDLGASLSPQLMGVVVDKVSATSFALNLASTLNVSSEQIGLRIGMLITAIFPILGAIVMIAIMRYFKNDTNVKLNNK